MTRQLPSGDFTQLAYKSQSCSLKFIVGHAASIRRVAPENVLNPPKLAFGR